MCGIAGRMGLAPVHAAAAAALAEEMGAALRRRGPDGERAHHDADLLLVHRRLSIIDLSAAGAQPLWNEEGTVCVIVNGEIYNFRELRRSLQERSHRFRSGSDSEVLVHLYEDSGIEGCCRAIEGMFAFALWDARTRDLFLVRDRLGIKPLVVAAHEAGVTFASTLSGLLTDPAVSPAMREEALVAVLKWGFVPSPWSAVRAARRILPGTWLRLRGGRIVEERRWWTDSPTTEPVADDDVRVAVVDAVRSHLIADVPVGALLSAGIDSGIVTGLAARTRGPEHLEVWTASHRGHPEDELTEAVLAARHFGVRLHEVPVGGSGLTEARFARMLEAMDEPLADASLVALHEL
ncbi:MAG: asparagine synthetase B, partial [Gemmatimonadota bacterium]|nr:asparagine synthetase B [Gemmatimonadota bacterium]